MPSVQSALDKALENTPAHPILSPPKKPSLLQKATQGLKDLGQDIQQTARRIQRGTDSLLDRLAHPSDSSPKTAAADTTGGSLVDRLVGKDADKTVYQTYWDSLSTKGTDFQTERAHTLAVAADYAYLSPKEVDQRMNAQGYKVEHFDQNGTQAFLATKGDHAILSFRGTESNEVQDIVADARVNQKPEATGKVHAGFQHALDQVWPQIQDSLKEKGLDQTPLYVTGHSLGAAVATLAANRLQDQGNNVQGLYTYGSPRVGNSDFAQHVKENGLSEKSWRVENHNDIVAKVPPPWLAGGYQHVGEHIYLDKDGAPHHNPDAELIRDSQRSLFSLNTLRNDPFENNGALDPMVDHRRSEYIQHLQDNINFIA